jgi:hypothetical protein
MDDALERARRRAAAIVEIIQALLEEDEMWAAPEEGGGASPSWMQRLLLTGGVATKATVREHAEPSWSETLSPHLIWKLGERTLFESHLDLSIAREGESDAEVRIAHLSYLLHDAATLGAGIFLVPFGFFNERVHAGWINPMPDKPLTLSDDGVTPTSGLGAQVRGAFPVGSSSVNYAAYVVNGPQVNQGTHKARDAGTLAFDQYADHNLGRAFGARAGWLPVPAVEVGYSVLHADVGSTNPAHGDLEAWLQGTDLNYRQLVPRLKGLVEARAEWIWSDVDRADFGQGAFENERSGGYGSVAYRPSQLKQKWLTRFGLALRYDTLALPGGAPAFDRQRWTAGLNYWLGPRSVIKTAYQFSEEERATGGDDRADAVLLEVFLGF